MLISRRVARRARAQRTTHATRALQVVIAVMAAAAAARPAAACGTTAAWSARGRRTGTLGFDLASLHGSQPGRRLLLWRFAIDTSFERTGRSLLVPYWSMGGGQVRETALGVHGALDAAVGIHLVRRRRFLLDVESGVVLPFSATDRLAGSRLQARLVFGLW